MRREACETITQRARIFRQPDASQMTAHQAHSFDLSREFPDAGDKLPEGSGPRVIVIGGGPVGARAAASLAENGARVSLISTERFAPYNRVKLTPLLAGDVQFGEIAAPEFSAEPPDGAAGATGAG